MGWVILAGEYCAFWSKLFSILWYGESFLESQRNQANSIPLIIQNLWGSKFESLRIYSHSQPLNPQNSFPIPYKNTGQGSLLAARVGARQIEHKESRDGTQTGYSLPVLG